MSLLFYLILLISFFLEDSSHKTDMSFWDKILNNWSSELPYQTRKDLFSE